MSSKSALKLLRNGSIPWSPDLKIQAEALSRQILEYPEETFRAALDAEAYLRAQGFLNGVKAYHNHPYVRDVEDPQAVFQTGNSRVLDYGGPADGPVLLAVPSLINKAYILDLNKQRSFMRAMAKSGVRSFLLDWGGVGEVEKHYELEDYILGRLSACVNEIHRLTGRKVCLLGYCMGGVLTTAFSVLEPEHVAAMVLLATPWDFYGGDGSYQRLIERSKQNLLANINLFGVLPIDVIQSLFVALDPYQIPKKFMNFASLKQDSAEARKFVAMEDWINDGVPLSGPVARTCLFDWYVENKPGKLEWEMDGHLIDPAEITCPTLIYIPQNDRIVPPECALALSKRIPNARTEKVAAGHIGMVSGSGAVRTLYNPVSKWLLENL